MPSSVKLYAGTSSQYLAEKIAKAYGDKLGMITHQQFSDGELFVSYDESVRGMELFLIQSTFPTADNLMQLMIMIDAAKRASAKYVTAVVPYFGYARQDRKDKPRVAITAKLVANILSAAGADRLMTCDLHAGQIQGFFDIPVDHLDGSALFIPYIQSLKLENLVIASPDVGGLTRARAYAKILNCELVVVDKHRKKANEIASMQLIGNVEDANVILIDDLVDTGGTICKAAALLKEKGAKTVRAFCTHPILSGKAYDNINGSVLEEMVVSDTIPLKQESSKIKVITVANLFALAIKKVHEHGSVSSLFL
ncbi:MAG: ribose-phosphate pyrophosphokinase [Bacteroidetes bacterium]|nr:MAG: ribose-phosphate pyrophosphokinase [Bacteroidota bacterium]